MTVPSPDLRIRTLTPSVPVDPPLLDAIARFLHHALGRYGDPLDDIRKAMAYALNPDNRAGQGGFILVARDGDEHILGATVVNDTGMAGYIPEHILVYIAVDPSARGQGLGRRMMETALSTARGAVALHVEPDNPARRLYEHLGFTSKYLEMRFQRLPSAEAATETDA